MIRPAFNTAQCGHLLRRHDGSCMVCPPPPDHERAYLDSLALRKALVSDNCLDSLAEFTREAWHVLEPTTPLMDNWHIDAVCDHIQASFEGWHKAKQDPAWINQLQNIVINIPPGTAKSRIISVMAPAWSWLRWPTMRLRCMSSNPRVALRDADYSRELLNSKWYRDLFEPKWAMKTETDAKGHFANTKGGERYSAGFTASIIGERTDVILVDDPHDPDDVHSPVQRQSVIDRWDMSIANRLSDLRCSVRIIVMQRVHENDLSGHVLRKPGWTHVCLPLEFDPRRRCETPIFKDPRTEMGEVLHPERFTPAVIAGEKSLGSWRYATQYQQAPAPTEGGIFKKAWFRHYDMLPDRFDDIVLSLDCAAKKTTDGSYSALVIIGRKGPMRYVLDVWRDRCSISRIVDTVKYYREKYPKAIRTLVEEKAAGPSVIEQLQTTLTGIIPINPGSDSKESRAMACQPVVESGNVLLPREAQWLENFLHELVTFPQAQNDDMLDAFTQCLNYMRMSNDAQRTRMGAKF